MMFPILPPHKLLDGFMMPTKPASKEPGTSKSLEKYRSKRKLKNRAAKAARKKNRGKR